MRIALVRLLVFTMLVIAAASLASAQKSRASVSASEVNGTYKMNFRAKFSRFSNEIRLLALGRGKVRVVMDLVYPYTLRNGEFMVNMGGLDGEAAIAADEAVYKTEDERCTITIKFLRPGSILVTQSGEDSACGFGHNVTADGTYRKVSARKPRFDAEP